MSRIRIALSSALVLAAACPKPARVPACAAGETNRCACASGAEGLQTCLPSRDAFGACVCSSACAGGASCVAMPSLIGKDLDQAGALVDQAQLMLPDPVDPTGFITQQDIADPPVQILAQDPLPGTPVKPGTSIKLTVTLPPDQETLGLPNSNFLVGRLTQDTVDSAASYYAVLDPGPFPKRATFADWKAANGFGTPADAEASAIYVTHTDLGFGRHMHMRRLGRRVAFYVDNYPSVEDAIAGTRFFATVAMEYSPGPNGKDTDPYFTQFYAFNKKGQRISDPILDDHGPKQLPAVCLVCHGGTTSDLTYLSNGGNLGAHFIPFDVDAERFSSRPGYARADQESAFKAFNEAVQITWDPADPAYPPGDPAPVPGLIDGWYGGPGHPSPTFLGSATPSGWDVSAESRALYHQVFAKSCQTCHSQREAARNFSTYAKFAAIKSLIDQRVFDEGAMPLSQRGSLNFWLSYPEQPKILANWLGTKLRSPGSPIPRVSLSPSNVVTAGTTVTLDGSDSQYAEAYNWQQTSGPNVTLNNQTTNGSKVSFVTPPLGANLAFQLTVSALGRTSGPSPVSVLSRSAPSAPQGVHADLGAASATVHWSPPDTDGLSAITGYVVTVTPGGATLSAGPLATSVLVGSLQPGISYVFAVAAVNAIGTGPVASTGSLRIPTVPGQPVGVSAVSPHTGGTLTVSWTPPADDGGSALTAFNVSCTPSGSATAGGSATSVPVTGLTNKTSYTCTVTATNVAGTGPASLGAVGIPDGPPSPPQNFSATPPTTTSEHLTWSAPANDGGFTIIRYIVTYTPLPSGTTTTIDAGLVLSIDITGLASGTSYSFTVAAVNSAGTGVAATTAPPVLPTILSPAASSSTGANSIPVTWTDSGTITSFTVQAKLAGTGTVAQTISNISPTTFSATLTGLTNCTAYDVYVTAINNAGSATASVANITPRQPPSVPSGLSVTKPSAPKIVGELLFTWSASSAGTCGTVSYTVGLTRPGLVETFTGVGTFTSFDWTESSTSPGGPIGACPYGSGVDCSNPNHWLFRVEATNNGGTSAFSTQVPGTPRMGYSRDNVNAIWAAKSCTGCHSGLSGSPPLNLNGSAATNLASINGTTGVINATVDNSYLLSCPSANSANPPPSVLCPYPTMTATIRIAANPPSTEYSAIQQWISDGVLGP